MKSFCWEDFLKELEATSPMFYRVLRDCVFRKQRKASKHAKFFAINDSAVIGMCVAILLQHRNSNMNLVQRTISTLLYSRHACTKTGKDTLDIILQSALW